MNRVIYRFDAVDWHVPVSAGTDPEEAAAAGRRGAGRTLLAQGAGGFYAQVVRMPPGFEAPRHSHDHEEVFMVLEGSCTFDGQPMGQWDMTVIDANDPYAFTAGPDGLSFLVVRTGKAAYASAGG